VNFGSLKRTVVPFVSPLTQKWRTDAVQKDGGLLSRLQQDRRCRRARLLLQCGCLINAA